MGFRPMVRLLLRGPPGWRPSRGERTEELRDFIAELKEALGTEERLKELEK